jgi:hypothetical protein
MDILQALGTANIARVLAAPIGLVLLGLASWGLTTIIFVIYDLLQLRTRLGPQRGLILRHWTQVIVPLLAGALSGSALFGLWIGSHALDRLATVLAIMAGSILIECWAGTHEP